MLHFNVYIFHSWIIEPLNPNNLSSCQTISLSVVPSLFSNCVTVGTYPKSSNFKAIFQCPLCTDLHLKADKEGSFSLFSHKMLSQREIYEVFLGGRSPVLGRKFLNVKCCLQSLGKYTWRNKENNCIFCYLNHFSQNLGMASYLESVSLVLHGILFFHTSEIWQKL